MRMECHQTKKSYWKHDATNQRLRSEEATWNGQPTGKIFSQSIFNLPTTERIEEENTFLNVGTLSGTSTESAERRVDQAYYTSSLWSSIGHQSFSRCFFVRPQCCYYMQKQESGKQEWKLVSYASKSLICIEITVRYGEKIGTNWKRGTGCYLVMWEVL